MATRETARPLQRYGERADGQSRYRRDLHHHPGHDRLKYIPLSPTGTAYLSLGGNQRVRYEANGAPNFSIGPRADDYTLGRTEGHADLRVGPMQAFVQLQSDWTAGKREIGPADRDRLDLEQGFLAIVLPVEPHSVFKARIGRQQFAFDKQRFVSVRNGPNVRQSFDALWADYETGKWRFIGYATQPVVTRDRRAFDDTSSRRLTFSGVRVERKVLGDNELSAYWSRFTQDAVRFGGALGDERRDVFDLRFAGTVQSWDWDAEAMAQTGSFAGQSINAWYGGALAGYTVRPLPLKPRLGLQVDLASGDRKSGDGRLGTFNPLFPSGTYLTLGGYTGLVNIVHLKPSLIIHPTRSLTLTTAVAAQWRMERNDAIYTQPNIPVPRTAGRGSLWTGSYGQVRADFKANYRVSFALEAVHFDVGKTLRDAGGKNANYLGIESNIGF